LAETSVEAPVETGVGTTRPGGDDGRRDAAVLSEAGATLKGTNPTSVTRGKPGRFEAEKTGEVVRNGAVGT